MSEGQPRPVDNARCPRKRSVGASASRPSNQFKIKRPTLAPNEKPNEHKYNQVVSILVKGDIIQLVGVWNENGSDDGFDPYLKNNVREDGAFCRVASIIRLAERRGLPSDVTEFMPSPQNSRRSGGIPFARHWYMRLVKETEENPQKRRRIVQSFANFLIKEEENHRKQRIAAEEKEQRLARESGARYQKKMIFHNHYIVPDHWDLTPEEKMPLDHYVTDSAVGSAIYATMALEPIELYKTFGADYEEDAKCFFSGPPYSITAVRDFGYPSPPNFNNPDHLDEYSSVDDGGSSVPKNLHFDEDDYFGNVSD